jgi:hypothetical protein
MDSGKSVAGKQSKPSHFDAAPFLVAAASVFITPEPGMSHERFYWRVNSAASHSPGKQ